MEKYIVNGMARLAGQVEIGGAKNAACPIIPAIVACSEPCIIENVPNVSDVSTIVEILQCLGATVERIDLHTLRIDPTGIQTAEVPTDLARHLRASYYFIGALLTRFGEAHVAMPGGCDLGPRPIDQHLKAFASLGCEWNVEYGVVNVKAGEKMTGAHIFFDVVSVGATINAMLAAVRAEGLTVLENVAKEPHIVDVANFLNSMGADIRGAGTDVIKIRGVEKLHGTTYSIVPDQIEAGTFMVAAAATRGDILLTNVIPKHLESISYRLVRAGVEITEYDDCLRVFCNRRLAATNIKTMPHPGFPTDLQPQAATMLCCADGTSIITEGIWDSRFRYVDELRRMGAKIQVDGKVAVIEGVDCLTGAAVRATDLRAGAALVIAGLMSQGETEIDDIYHIERGYEDIVGKLRSIGAQIEKRIYSDDYQSAAL